MRSFDSMLTRMLLKSLGIAVFLAGAIVWAIAFSGLLLNAADFAGLTGFSWSLFGIAVAALLIAIAGAVMFRAGSRPQQLTIFKI